MSAPHPRTLHAVRHAEPDRPPQPYRTRTDAIACGLLIEIDPRLARAFRFTHPLALTVHVWTDVLTRPGQSTAREGHDLITTLLDVLAEAEAARHIASTETVPFTVYRHRPDGCHPMNLTITTTTGDHGEHVHTIDLAPAPPAGTFRLTGQPNTWPALRFHDHTGQHPDDTRTGADPGGTVPVVTSSVLILLLAQQIDTGTVSAAHLQPGPAGTVRLADNTGRIGTLHAQPDGTYDLAALADLGWTFTRAA